MMLCLTLNGPTGLLKWIQDGYEEEAHMPEQVVRSSGRRPHPGPAGDRGGCGGSDEFEGESPVGTGCDAGPDALTHFQRRGWGDVRGRRSCWSGWWVIADPAFRGGGVWGSQVAVSAAEDGLDRRYGPGRSRLAGWPLSGWRVSRRSRQGCRPPRRQRSRGVTCAALAPPQQPRVARSGRRLRPRDQPQPRSPS
jgi:hypothetical protein